MKKNSIALSSLLLTILLFSCARGNNKSQQVSSELSSEQSSFSSESISKEEQSSSQKEESSSISESSSEVIESSSISESSSEVIDSSSINESSYKESSLSSNDSYSFPNYVGGDLIFSELFIGDAAKDRAVEIANIGENIIDLSTYKIEIFRDGKNKGPSETIFLQGLINPYDTYVIAYSLAKEEILNKASLISDDFLNDGTFPMTINNYNDEIIDTIGYVGYYVDIAYHQDSVRKIEYLVNEDTYIPYGWIRYPNTDYSHLGNLDCLDNDTIYNGPKLTNEDFAKPYAVDSSAGSGGLIEVSFVSGIDGDTSKFNFGYSLQEFDIYGTMSLRYYGINTPEIAHGGNPADPYGPEAKAFTNSILSKCKHFLVQSVTGGALHETYGRALGYLWVTYENNPSIDDYFLLNHLIIQNGFSNPAHVTRGGIADKMLYKGISYIEYLFDANEYAKKEKLNIHSGV